MNKHYGGLSSLKEIVWTTRHILRVSGPVGEGGGREASGYHQHDVAHARPFSADEVGHRDLHVVELDVGCSGRDLTANLEAPHGHTRMVFQGDDQQRDASSSAFGRPSADGHGGVVSPDPVGNPDAVSCRQNWGLITALRTCHFFAPLTT